MSSHFSGTYRDLSSEEKDQIQNIKDIANLLYAELEKCHSTPDMDISKIRLKESVMWATRSITR